MTREGWVGSSLMVGAGGGAARTDDFSMGTGECWNLLGLLSRACCGRLGVVGCS